MQGGTREYYVWYISHTLVLFPRSHYIILAARNYLPRLIKVKEGSTHTIYKTITGVNYTMVNHKPAFICLDRNRSRSYLS